MAASVRVDISPGELIDKLTILEIKRDRVQDPDKRAKVEVEHGKLVVRENLRDACIS